MRKETLLMVLGIAVVAAATYYILEVSVERAPPQLADVVPDEPPVVKQSEAAKAAEDMADIKAEADRDMSAGAADSADETDGSGQDQDADATDSGTAAAADSQAAGETQPQAETGAAAANPQTDEHPSQPMPDAKTSQPPADDQDQTDETAEQSSAEAAPDKTASEEATAEDTEPQKLVATATINVRTGAGENHEVVGQVSPQQTVTVIGGPEDDWVEIEHGELSGWVFRPLFETP